MAFISCRSTGRSLSLCALSALLLVPVTGAVAQTVDELPAGLFPSGARRGDAAIALLAGDLAETAAAVHMTADELADDLRNDTSLWVSADKRLFFVDIPAAPRDGAQNGSYAGSTTIPPEDAFTLHSRPGASKTIYLDFDGHHSVSNSWGHNIQFPPYNTSGSSSTFSTSELNQIIQWWYHVAEDFMPFDVNVTTEDPGLGALTKSGGGDTTWGVRCLNTQPTGGFGNGIGGVAYLNSFNDSIDNPVFVFNKGTNTGAMSASHEVGHAFGLGHDGLNGSSYHPGTGSGETSWGPIMGAPFGANLVQWSRGEYTGATTTQNDTNIITNTSNGVNYMDDDHGDTVATATPLPPSVGCPVPAPSTAEGLIERRNDVDAFSFTTNAGVVTIDALPFDPFGNLDIELQLLDATGALVASDNPVNATAASLSVDVPAGTYAIVVDGIGKDPTYTDYGCRGQYTVTMAPSSGSSVTNLGGAVAGAFGFVPILSASGTLCSGNDFTLSLASTSFNAPAFLAVGLAELSAPFKGGILVPDIAPPGGLINMATGIAGQIQLITPWPAGVPSGFALYLQFWIQDAAAVKGFSASDGLLIVAP